MLKIVRRLLAVALFAPTVAIATTLPFHPMDFDGSEAQKAEVIEFITKVTKSQYCTNLNMCQDVTLRRMERANLDAFKKLTEAKNRKILDQVIDAYCTKLNNCNFIILERMYRRNLEASQQKLTW